MANFGISEKIETFISENFKIFGYDLNFLMWTPPVLGLLKYEYTCGKPNLVKFTKLALVAQAITYNNLRL